MYNYAKIRGLQFMLKISIKCYIIIFFTGNIPVFADINLQKGLYDAAEDIMDFDEKLNRLIAKHNGVEYKKEDSSDIMDFEEKEYSYILERKIEDDNNTQIEITLVERILSIEITVREQIEIKTEAGVSQETTLTQSITPLYLPQNADENTMQDSYRNGVLKITFKKLY